MKQTVWLLINLHTIIDYSSRSPSLLYTQNSLHLMRILSFRRSFVDFHEKCMIDRSDRRSISPRPSIGIVSIYWSFNGTPTSYQSCRASHTQWANWPAPCRICPTRSSASPYSVPGETRFAICCPSLENKWTEKRPWTAKPAGWSPNCWESPTASHRCPTVPLAVAWLWRCSASLRGSRTLQCWSAVPWSSEHPLARQEIALCQSSSPSAVVLNLCQEVSRLQRRPTASPKTPPFPLTSVDLFQLQN